MAKSVLDLYELYKLVIGRGGLVNVINKKLWQEIIKDLNLPSSITSAAFTLRTQYVRYLYPYETDKFHLSTEAELTAAIENNKRDGSRRSCSNNSNNYMSPPQFSPQPNVQQRQQQQMMRMVSVCCSRRDSISHHDKDYRLSFSFSHRLWTSNSNLKSMFNSNSKSSCNW